MRAIMSPSTLKVATTFGRSAASRAGNRRKRQHRRNERSSSKTVLHRFSFKSAWLRLSARRQHGG